MRLEPIKNPSLARSLLPPAIALGTTVVFASLLAMVAGANPFSVFGLILSGAFGSKFAILETLNRATPLVFTGLAAAVAFRAKFWNIGAEAQLYSGALLTVLLGTGLLQWPSIALLPTIMLFSILAGAILLLVPALLKTRFGVDEVVTTLLFNFIFLLFISMLLEGPIKDPMGMGWPKSARVIPEARLPRLVDGLRLHWGFALAIFSAICIWIIQTRSTLGYEMRAVGLNKKAAGLCGYPSKYYTC